MTIDIIEEWKVNNSFSTPLAKQLADNIRWSISTGSIKPGEKLLPLRELSTRLNLSINTVRTAYKMLEEQQLVITRPYHGTMVVDFPSKLAGELDNSANDTMRILAKAVISIANTGLSMPEIKAMFEKVCEKISENSSSVRILFIECSEYECKSLSAQIAQELGIRVDYRLLEELEEAIRQEKLNLDDYKAVITSYFHYSTVIQSVKPHAIPVLGMVVEMPAETAKYIATMPSGHKAGIICEPTHSIQYLINLVKCKRDDIEIITAFSDDDERVGFVLDNADAIFIAPPLKQSLQGRIKAKPMFLFVDHINSQSIDMLRQFIQSDI